MIYQLFLSHYMMINNLFSQTPIWVIDELNTYTIQTFRCERT
jgi:hypothetical protein